MYRTALFLFSLMFLSFTQLACQQESSSSSAPTASTSVAAATPTPAPTLAASVSADGMKTLPNGLQFKDLVVGTGKRPRYQQEVKLEYIGKTQDGKIFDQGKLNFKLGDPEYLKGWNLGILGSGEMDAMKVGGKRLIVLPSDLAFGNIGVPGKVSPNATISFEMELLEVK